MVHAFVNFRSNTAFLGNHYHQHQYAGNIHRRFEASLWILLPASWRVERSSRRIQKTFAQHRSGRGLWAWWAQRRAGAWLFLQQSLAMVGKFWRCLKQCRNIFKTFVWCFPPNIWGSNSRSDFSGGLKAPTSNCTRPLHRPFRWPDSANISDWDGIDLVLPNISHATEIVTNKEQQHWLLLNVFHSSLAETCWQTRCNYLYCIIVSDLFYFLM